MRYIVRFFFWVFGWEIDKHVPDGVRKCVIAMGPHTSNWDFVLGKMAFISYGVNVKYLIKKELFFFPLGFILKYMGGLPVDRSKKNNISEKAKQFFAETDDLFLCFAPEGTRKYNSKWKKGFYYIAIESKVPIYIVYVDYKNKKGGFHSLFEPTGDIDKDFRDIKRILSKFEGKVPENGIKEE